MIPAAGLAGVQRAILSPLQPRERNPYHRIGRYATRSFPHRNNANAAPLVLEQQPDNAKFAMSAVFV